MTNPNQRGGADTPAVFVEGIEEILKRDLAKHKELLARTQTELTAYRQARSHEVKRKKHYKSLIGGEKYNDAALRTAMDGIAVNIRHMSDKCQAAEEKLKHHTLIVDTLTAQLDAQNEQLKLLEKIRAANGSGD